jgi:hypothetical protein
MTRAEFKSFRNRVYALWQEGRDTVDMSKALQVPESECEKALHVALNLRRSIAVTLVRA